MTVKAQLAKRAMKLPEGDRADLARRLILSLEDTDIDPDADKAWALEIESRLSAVDRGEVKLLDWRRSIRRIRKSLAKDRPE